MTWWVASYARYASCIKLLVSPPNVIPHLWDWSCSFHCMLSPVRFWGVFSFQHFSVCNGGFVPTASGTWSHSKELCETCKIWVSSFVNPKDVDETTVPVTKMTLSSHLSESPTRKIQKETSEIKSSADSWHHPTAMQSCNRWIEGKGFPQACRHRNAGRRKQAEVGPAHRTWHMWLH